VPAKFEFRRHFVILNQSMTGKSKLFADRSKLRLSKNCSHARLDHRNERHRSRLFDSERLHQLRRLWRLLGVVLHDVARQDVGVEADHLAAEPRAAIVLFMSSIDTRFFANPSTAFNSVTECVAATTSNRPGSTSTNSTRSPRLT
jgi:hypothetical protein